MQKKDLYSEFELMEGFRMGLEKSFSEIFLRLYPALTFYALRMTSEQDVAEDIAEESLLKVWDRRVSFYEFKALKSYLYTTVRHASLKWLEQDRPVQLSKTEIAVASPSADRSSLEQLIEAELFREVYSHLDKLPSQAKEIVNMIFFEGKTARQVSIELGLSVSTVKTQKARALSKLRKYLSLPALLVILTVYC